VFPRDQRFGCSDAGGAGVDGDTLIDDVTVDATPTRSRPATVPSHRPAGTLRKRAR
jgi:hypothetical protein